LSPAITIDWTNKYGIHEFGYLVKPTNHKLGVHYPLVVVTEDCRGFLRGGQGHEYPIQVFAANGFAVLCSGLLAGARRVPPSGNFEETLMRWKVPMASLETATKMLTDMGVVDPRRKGLTGLSYGAEVTSFTISHSDLFQAAITSSGSGRDPIFYYFANNFWHQQFVQWGLGGIPEGKTSKSWQELSPALNAERVKAPLLIQSADSEYLLGLQFYTALKELDKPGEFFIYADEGHIKNHPKHRFEIYERNLDWFNFWLQDKEDPDRAKADQYTRWRELKKLQEKKVLSQ